MNRSTALGRVAGLALALAAPLAYYAVGTEFYNRYWIPQGYGMDYVLVQELAHGTLFVLFGLAAAAGLWVVLDGLTLTDRDLDRLAGLGASWAPVVLGGAALVFLGTLAIARGVLDHAVVTDDEHTYRFIAQTLRTGAVTAPSPGGDLPFFREQFVVLTDQVRYGKYPIGHPLLLALGQLLGVEGLVVPLVTALVVVPLYALGALTVGRPAAGLAVVLFALSPQVLLTGATLLSQPASALCLITGLAGLLAAEDGRRPHVWLAVAGLAFGYGVLVRPLPGVLFALVAAAYLALTARAPRLSRLAAFGVPLAALAVVFVLVSRAQTGSFFHTGYDASDTPGQGVAGLVGVRDFGLYAMSLASHLLRLNLWLFGWPLSLVLCLFARRTPRIGLLWAMIGAGWVYRLLAPKSGVAVTGPLYLFETVPLLCLLSADGLGQLVAAGRRSGRALVAARRAVALVLAGTLVSAAMFLPVKLANLRRMAEAQLVLPRMIARHDIRHALVFYDWVVPGTLGLSWAYFPRANSPGLDDDVLYVRFLKSQGAVDRNLEFWRRRFPDRSAWYFGYLGPTPVLLPLDAYLGTHPAGTDRPAPSP